MILQSFFGKLADSTPFTDAPLGVHWEELGSSSVLWDEGYRVGHISKMFETYKAEPYWNEQEQVFETLEEAQAWLLAMYRIGGKIEPTPRRRPAAK